MTSPLFSICVGSCVALAATAAHAGGGPENVLLLVNANSDSSKWIANYYIELRKIPPMNVLYVDWTGSLEIGSAESLRNKILVPALKALEDRKLTPQIDYLVYSSDFPWRVELLPMFPKESFPPPIAASASITGATYLLQFTVDRNFEIVSPVSNWYVPGVVGPNVQRCTQLANVPSRGFRSQYLWDSNGNKTADAAKGRRYLLSTMLGVTQGRGNTVAEVLSYLGRSAAADRAGADGKRPDGTIYFMWNKDIRSAIRDKCFESVAAQINALGVRAKVQQGRVPDGAKDVTGMMVGASDFDLTKSNITIQRGAICEHFTSVGGFLEKTNFQTPLSEFLRHGAAGASGTVVEPLALQCKFPLPSLQLHYARGCSLAEAFYQSVSGPYQLLIVGDPLCQPWATVPKVSVKGIKAGETVQGTISITPSGFVLGRTIGTWEFFLDGRPVARKNHVESVPIDTTKLADGFHDLRVVGTNSDTIETQGRLIVPFFVRNQDVQVELKVTPNRAKFSDKLRVSVRQPGATAVTIRQNSRDLGRVQGEAGEIELAAAKLGRGPTSLQAYSEGKVTAVSAPVPVVIE